MASARSVVAPSAQSTFRFVPIYFKSGTAGQYKLDADLATAIAQATARSLRRVKEREREREREKKEAWNGSGHGNKNGSQGSMWGGSTNVGSFRQSVKYESGQ